MIRQLITLSCLIAFILGGIAEHACGQEDPGKAPIGGVRVSVYHAFNGNAKPGGANFRKMRPGVEKRLRGEKRLRFKHYRLLGTEVQPLFRSYENWAQPLRPSDEVLVRFAARSKPTQAMTKLDLELWLSRKKILKTDVRLEGNNPLLILGPQWRGGRLIISVALAPLGEPRPY